jgi:hypothetical protein
MYLQQSVGNRPYLNFRIDEPDLLHYWFVRFPVSAMCEVYKLDYAKGEEWQNHFRDFIVETNCGNPGPTDLTTGRARGGVVPEHNRDRSEQLFEKWMHSSEDSELFKTVKLSAIKAIAGIISAVTLIEDVYCFECEETEPAFIYLTSSVNFSGNPRFHSDYPMLGAMLDKPLFGYCGEEGQPSGEPEMASCHICRPGDSFITENMASLARRKFSQCKCAPCRGRL